MKIYFDGIQLIGLAIMAIGGLIVLFSMWAQRYWESHNNWLSRFLAKLYGIK